MTRSPILPAAFAAMACLASPAAAQPADGEMLLAAFENCLAWANRGFPDATPFDSGFIVETPFTPGGTGTYEVADTGMQIELMRGDDTAACRVVGAGAEASADLRSEILARMDERADAGRTHRVREAVYALCDDPLGVFELIDMAGNSGLAFDMRWGGEALIGITRACPDGGQP